MNVTMVLTAMVNSGGSAFLVVFVAVIREAVIYVLAEFVR